MNGYGLACHELVHVHGSDQPVAESSSVTPQVTGYTLRSQPGIQPRNLVLQRRLCSHSGQA